jgi:hypothetical protein
MPLFWLSSRRAGYNYKVSNCHRTSCPQLYDCQSNPFLVAKYGQMTSSDGIELPPMAPMLMQSLRAVGYTTSAALADLVDNSIAASASIVRISFSPTPEPMVAVVDNGSGMNRETLIAAMRFGSRDPREERLGMDLGRFGLGLKTASLSQCRRVTVASLQEGTVSTAEWDLDECESRGTWWLGIPEKTSIPPELLQQLKEQGKGTAVILRKLDRLIGPRELRPLEVALNDAADHLAMVFHRFLAGDFIEAFDIRINERPLPRLDPFLEGHARGQSLHSESFSIEGHAVTVSPFVLPFPSRLQPSELDQAGGRESLKTSHGFYVYRGGRLVVPGGWFRIVPSDELIRLARVRVDVPVELDHLWKVDIRKTMAEPPAALRPELRRIVGAVTLRSRKVYTFRGTSQQSVERIHLWVRHDLRDGSASWRVNREHPLVSALLATSTSTVEVERMLKVLEDSLPLHDIHLHISNDLPVMEGSGITDDDLEILALRLIDALQGKPEVIEQFLERLPLTDPFSRDPTRARAIAERLRK